jgi:hypothetical protein
MPDEPKRRGPFAFQQEFSVDQPAPGKAYFIFESDWKRIKRMIQEIVPYGGGYQVLWSICSGICASSVFLLVTLGIEGNKVPTWAWTITWVAAVATCLVGVLSCFVDRAQRKAVSRSTASVLDEMTLLEKRHDASQEPNDGATSTPPVTSSPRP